MSDRPGWGKRLHDWAGAQRKRLSDSARAGLRAVRDEAVRILTVLNEAEAAGGTASERRFTIDDGVDYSLPLVVPDWATPEQKAALVQGALTEANAAYHFQFDRPYLYNENPSQFPTESPLREWDQTMRREVISRSHLAYARNPLAKRAINLTTEFVMGDGLTITYSNQDVKKVIEDFRANRENDVEGYEKSLCTDLQLDGEVFIQFFKDDQGQTVIVPIPPWEIIWIVSEMGFRRRVESYHRIGNQSTGFPGNMESLNVDIPAEQVLHVAINRHSYEVRGKAELFVILPWLKAYKDWLENRARQNYYRGAIIYDVTLDDAQPSQVSAKRAQYKQPPSPGSIAIHNSKEHWAIQESKVGAADVAEDGRQIKLMSAVGKGVPEYMLSDGENANLASATAQQLPALRTFGSFQDVMVGQMWKPVYQQVIRNAVLAGILKEMVEQQDTDGDPVKDKKGATKMIKAEDAFDVVPPELESDDPKNLAQALQIATGEGWVSDETASGRMGFEYDLEQKKIEKKLARDQERQAQGLMPSGFNPTQQPLAPFGAQQPNAGHDAPPPKPKEKKLDPATGAPEGDPPPPKSPVSEAAQVTSVLQGLTTIAGQAAAAGVREVIKSERETERAEAAQRDERLTRKVDALGNQAIQNDQLNQRRIAGVADVVISTVTPLVQSVNQIRTEVNDLNLKIRRDWAELRTIREQLENIGETEQAPANISLDAAMVERIAAETAKETVEQMTTAMETVTQEISERDSDGRALEVSRMLASGAVVKYRIRRDAGGRMTGLERV